MSRFKHLAESVGAAAGTAPDAIPDGTGELAEATASETVTLQDGATFALRAGPVHKRVAGTTLTMLAYNGSIPGPTLMVGQGSGVTVHFANQTDLETAVYWRGLRLDNALAAGPHAQHPDLPPAVPADGGIVYQLHCPDPGVYCYYPHIRDNDARKRGLYGNIVVVPDDPAYWAPVNREYSLTLDDVPIPGSRMRPDSQASLLRTQVGSLARVVLVGGETDGTLCARRGEVVRLYLSNAATRRTFRLRIPGPRLKLVGRDRGRVERETFVEEVLIAPAERAVVDVLFDRPGRFQLEHRIPGKSYPLGTALVADERVKRSFKAAFETLRYNPDLEAERVGLVAELARDPDMTLAFAGRVQIKGRPGIPELFKLGTRVKIRLANRSHANHPAEHLIHIDRQRFLVLSRDGVPNDNLAWKDTVLLRGGEVVDILVEIANPGTWTLHCRAAETPESGMTFSFDVHDGAQGVGGRHDG